eukprot:8332770-Pyramimonas_sp.AAC.1
MGPACAQIFLIVCAEISKEGDEVGAKNRASWENHKARLDAITDQEELTILVRGFRVSSAYREGTAKLVISLGDPQLQ